MGSCDAHAIPNLLRNMRSCQVHKKPEATSVLNNAKHINFLLPSKFSLKNYVVRIKLCCVTHNMVWITTDVVIRHQLSLYEFSLARNVHPHKHTHTIDQPCRVLAIIPDCCLNIKVSVDFSRNGGYKHSSFFEDTREGIIKVINNEQGNATT